MMQAKEDDLVDGEFFRWLTHRPRGVRWFYTTFIDPKPVVGWAQMACEIARLCKTKKGLVLRDVIATGEVVRVLVDQAEHKETGT